MKQRKDEPVDDWEQTKSLARGALIAWFDLLDSRRPCQEPIDRDAVLKAAD